jgi:hypothetical protein
MKSLTRIAAIGLAFSLTGCYHAVIETGRPADTSSTITIPWAHSFIFGLVPPKLVDAAQQCTNGVARVETQHSFLNGLAAVLTFSIYTPMQIDVTCASRGGAAAAGSETMKVGEGQSIESAMDAAVRRSAETSAPVYLQLD